MFIDTHAHLDFPEFSSDVEAVLERAARVGVVRVITIGISLESSQEALRLARLHPQVYATAGIHPHGAFLLGEAAVESLTRLADSDRVVAMGEMGLDYYRDRQPRTIQQECLRQQLEIACRLKKPAVFHIREAHNAFLEIISDYSSRLAAGILHCFSGDWTVAKRCLDLGFYLSIPGTVTYNKAETQQEVVRRAPMDRLLIETDAPYLAPVPFRGKVNEPALVVHTAAKIAELRGCSVEEVADRTTQNARAAFRIDAPSDRASGR